MVTKVHGRRAARPRRVDAALDAPAGSGAPPAPRARVVVCDDDVAIRALYRRALVRADIEVHDAVDGEACLALVPTLAPDLVVLDLTLPGRDGLDVLRELRASCPAIPVVVVSGAVTPPVVDAAIAAGAAACIGKVEFLPQLAALLEAVGC